MSRPNQIDRAIDALEQKKAAIIAQAHAEAAAITQAIDTLRGQRVKARVSRPRPVAEKVS